MLKNIRHYFKVFSQTFASCIIYAVVSKISRLSNNRSFAETHQSKLRFYSRISIIFIENKAALILIFILVRRHCNCFLKSVPLWLDHYKICCIKQLYLNQKITNLPFLMYQISFMIQLVCVAVCQFQFTP